MTSTSSASATAAPTKDRASCGGPGAPQTFAQRWLQPRYLIVALITLILVTGQIEYAILRSYSVLAICLGTAIVTEVVLSKLLRGEWPNVQSAYVSGISATLLTKPEADALWPFIAVPALAIASKYVIAYRGRHLWNPTNFSICCVLLAAPSSVAVLSHEFGNEWGTLLVIWIVGGLIAWRAKILHITFTYVAAFLLLAPLRAWLGHADLRTEVAPITGPMYQLFIFFMITDPRTVVSQKKWRIAVAVIIAIVEVLIRLGNDFDLSIAKPFSAAPALFALTFVGPIAMWIDLRRKAKPVHA